MSKPTVIDVAKSILSAAIGVQSNKNRERDFQHGSFASYVIGGVIFTIAFIFAIVFIVSLVL